MMSGRATTMSTSPSSIARSDCDSTFEHDVARLRRDVEVAVASGAGWTQLARAQHESNRERAIGNDRLARAEEGSVATSPVVSITYTTRLKGGL